MLHDVIAVTGAILLLQLFVRIYVAAEADFLIELRVMIVSRVVCLSLKILSSVLVSFGLSLSSVTTVTCAIDQIPTRPSLKCTTVTTQVHSVHFWKITKVTLAVQQRCRPNLLKLSFQNRIDICASISMRRKFFIISCPTRGIFDGRKHLL